MAGVGATQRYLPCPTCGGAIRPPAAGAPDESLLTCPNCGGAVRARRRPGGPSGEVTAIQAEPTTAGPWAVAVRHSALRALEWTYRVGAITGGAAVFALGGFIPVTAAWLRDELSNPSDAFEALGGVAVRSRIGDPDADLGPALGRSDAPRLFAETAEIARRLGARMPDQIRLTYLPCCGLVAWRRSRALMIGLPLLHVLNVAELRAVLAHELAHHARGDAGHAERSARFVEGLNRALERPNGSWGPLKAWALMCGRLGARLAAPVALGREARADRTAASIAGGSVAASALVKTAQVQPLFRELLGRYDPSDPDRPNLYAFFRRFWERIPEELHTAIRHDMLRAGGASTDGIHPPLLDRLGLVQSYPERPLPPEDAAPAATLLGDVEALEQMLHNRLFAVAEPGPSVFHRAGS